MGFKKISLTLILILLFGIGLFTAQSSDISINSAFYQEFKTSASSQRLNTVFINTPESELVILKEKIPGIRTQIKLSQDRKKFHVISTSIVENTTLRHQGSIIREGQSPTNPPAAASASSQGTNNSSAAQNPALSSTISAGANLVIKQLYSIEINPELAEITNYKKIIKDGFVFLLLTDNTENLTFFQIAVANGKIERKWNISLKTHFKIQKKKTPPLVFDPLRRTQKQFTIRRFAIQEGKLLVLGSNGILSIIHLLAGKITYQLDLPNPLCSLTVHGGYFYYVHTGMLYARHLHSGKILYAEKLADMEYSGSGYVFSVNTELDVVLVGIPSKAGFSVYRKKDGKWLYAAPYSFIAAQSASINRFGLPAGSALTYAYHQGIVYISWYDQWKPDMSRGWLTAHNILDGKLLWNIPLRYNNGREALEATQIEFSGERIRLHSRTHIIILRPAAGG